MKKIFSFALLCFVSFAFPHYGFAANEIGSVVDEVNNLQDKVEEHTPEEIKGFFARLDAWRIEQANGYIMLRDRQDDILHPQGDDKTVHFDENGDIVVETGISEAREQPKEAALFYYYLTMAFIFSTVYLFYAVLILLVLSVIRMLWRLLFHRGA